jgi:DNA repair exonuclease SbcCD ATPase subunit
MKIVHFSDLHVRNYSRHEEYRRSLENFYESLKKEQPDLIVFTGDLCHLKTKISPELVQFCSEVFIELASIAPLHLILGNHDCSLKNVSRLDAITPVVEALNNPNIRYYKESGVYPVNLGMDSPMFNLVVFSCFDKNWPTQEDVKKNGVPGWVNIGLYHGFIRGAELQNGMTIDDGAPSVKKFLKLVDYLMMGDIHKMQVLDHKFRAAYAGSLIQQNYGESTSKGYLLWEIESKKKHNVDFVKLPNVCPFRTVKLEDDLQIPKLDIQPKSRIRILSRQLSVLEKTNLKEKFTELFNPLRLDFLDEVSAYAQDVKLSFGSTKIENLDDLGVQESLLSQFLKPSDLEKDLMEKIFEINRRYNTHIRKEEDTLRNVQYRFGKLQWSNAFSFAEDNELDFPGHKGVLGIFGKSAVGKSSAAVDIPLYCMFNKISKRVTKNDTIINENKDECSAEIEVFLRNKMYKISRKTDTYLKSGKRKGKPVYQGRTEVDFRSFDVDGTEQILNGGERLETDAEIRKVFGTPEDFIATSVAPQWKLLNIVEAGATERQKLIGRYFDVDIFYQKYDLARDELKEIKKRLRDLGGEDIQSEVIEQTKILCEIQERLKKNEESKEFQTKSKNRLDESVQELRSQIVNVNVGIDEESVSKKLEKAKDVRKKLLQDLYDVERKLEIYDIKNLLREEVAIIEIEKTKKQLKDHNCENPQNCCLKKKLEKGEKLRKKAEVSKDIKDCHRCAKNKEKLREKIPVQLNEITELVKLQDAIKVNKKQLIENEEIKTKIRSCEFRREKVEEALQETLSEALRLSKEEGAIETQLQAKKAAMDEYERLKVDYEAYDHFIRAMSKDGLPRQIISNNLGIINSEIEKILAHGVGFTVAFESNEDGKAIDIFFKHERSKKRYIEICSGMEKTLAEIAIRAALINITTLPRSNIFVLDEAFGALDSEYMSSLVRILDYLKTLFEVIIIITHEDELKDVVDHVIEVERDEEGYSRLN